MTTIKYGNQHDDSESHHEIISDGGSSNIGFGDQFDRSKLDSRILDLRDPADIALIADELAALTRQVEHSPQAKAHPEDLRALKEATASAAAGNGDSAKAALKSVGKWVLDTATAIGTPLAIQFLKTAIGLS